VTPEAGAGPIVPELELVIVAPPLAFSWMKIAA